MKVTVRRFALAAALTCLALASALSGAQTTYPSGPVKIIVALAPGASNDSVARFVAQGLTQRLKQPFVVENVVGAGGTIAANRVAKAVPDGYTLLLGNTSLLAIQPTLMPGLPYDARTAFDTVTIIGEVPTVLVVGAGLPVKNIAEFVAYAKAHPGKLSYASPGNGSPFHLAGELFKLQTSTDLVHSAYKGVAPALTDVASGQVSAMFANLPDVMPFVTAGRLRILAVTSAQRLPQLPNLPTMKEAGFVGAESQSFFVITTPKGTPAAITDKLNSEIEAMFAQPEYTARLATLGAHHVSGDTKFAARYVEKEAARWANIVKSSGMKMEAQ